MTRPTTLLFLNLAHFLDHYFLLIFATAVLAIHPAWGMSYGEAFALGTPAFVAFAAGTLPSGWLGDRWGGTRMMRIFFIGLGLAAIAVGLAPGPIALALALGMLGLFASIYHPVATAMVVGLADRPGRALGVNGVFGNLGVAAAALFTGVLTAAFGWRYAFIIPGSLTLLLGIVYAIGSRRSRLEGGHRPTESPVSAAVETVGQGRVLFVVGVSALFGGLIFNGVTLALPKLFEERLSALAPDLLHVGALAALAFALAAFAQIPVGRLLDRLGARPILLVAAGLQVPFLLLAGLASGAEVLLAAVPLMLLVFGEIPVTAWLIGRYTVPGWRSRAYGLVYLLSLGVSALVVPTIASLHERTGGSGALFMGLSLAALMIFGAAWALPGRRPVAAAGRPVAAHRASPT